MNDNKGILASLSAGAIIGALVGLGLSFTALPPLAVGAIVAAAPLVVNLVLGCIALYMIKGEDRLRDCYKSLSEMLSESLSSKSLFLCCCITSAAIGIGLAAGAMAIFPGVTLGVGSTALAGAVIGAVAPIVGSFVTGKVNDYIISPIVEHFSPKEQGI